jgi:hypothetical protein
MDSSYEANRVDLQTLAYAVGQLCAHVGDFYDVVGNFAVGFRDAILTGEIDDALSPVYTALSQAGPLRTVAVVPKFSDAQGQPAVPISEHYRWVFVALNELQSAADSTIALAAGEARAEGISWAQIGRPLEISRQAAQQRFGTPANVFADESDA